MGKEGEVHVDLSEVQWAFVKAALEGQIATSLAYSRRLELQRDADIERIANLEAELAEGHEVMRTAPRRIRTLQNQLHALHEEFRTAAARLRFTANWLENSRPVGSASAISAREYADLAKEVLDRGLDWLVERNRGRGVMESTADSKSAGEGSSPSVRAIQNTVQSCMRCASGGKCVYSEWSGDYIWLEVKQRLEDLSRSDDLVWNVNQQRAILNMVWHYRHGGRAA